MSVVWAAFRERNFEVGEPFLRARSVPSKYCFFRTYASAKRFFLIKSHNLPLFALFFAFSTALTRATYRALPDLQRSELPSTARPASDLLSPATNSLSNTVDIRLIYGTYTVDTRYISIFTP